MKLAGVDEPFVVVLVGAAGAGKSAWAAERFRRSEVVSSDELRAVVGVAARPISPDRTRPSASAGSSPRCLEPAT